MTRLKARARSNKSNESALDLLLASFLSKTSASLITYPHEVVRSRMMDSRSGSKVFQMATRIYEREGWMGFYSGLHISLIRVIPNCCITFMSYELLLRFAREKIAHRELERQR
jgi:solute carrier family 25 folate transporter 32